MTAITFDTHKFVRRLVEDGATEKQAQAHVEALQEALGSHAQTFAEGLATKADLKELELVTKTSLKELELRLTLRLGGIVMAGIAVLGVAVKLL